MPTALFMAAKKDDELVDFARSLEARGWNLLGSRGTALHLGARGVVIQDMAVLVGDPLLGHRVVSLSREIHAGLLSKPEDQAELDALGIPRIDLVFVDFYHTEQVIAQFDSIVDHYDEINEQIDVGGPAAVCAAIKGGRLVLTSSIDFPQMLDWLEMGRPSEHRVLKTLWANAATSVEIYHRSVAEFRRKYQRAV